MGKEDRSVRHEASEIYSNPVKGDDLRFDLEIDFNTARFGGEKIIHMHDLGTTKQVKVTIPPGARNGDRLCVTGVGNAGPNGGPPGDLHVFLNVKDLKLNTM